MNTPEISCEPSLDDGINSDLLQQIELLLLQAVTFHQAGQVDEAARIYRNILQKSPLQPNANHNLGLITLEEKNINTSINLFRTALESAPEEPLYWTSYIEVLLQAGQIDDAEQVLAHGVEGGLQGAEVELLKRKLVDAHDAKLAVNDSEQLLVSSTDSALVLIEAQQHKKITKVTAKAASNDKKNGKPNTAEMNAIAVLFNQGLLAECEPLAIRMTQDFPRHGLGWKVLGAIRQQQGMIEEAFYALQMAAELLPSDSEAQYNLGNCFYDQQQLDEAVVCYKKSIKLTPNFSQAHYNLGNVLKKKERLEQAKTSYKKALKIEPKNAHIACNLAHVLYEQQLFAEAKSYFELVLQIQENFTAAHVGLGAALQALGRLPDAEESFRNALSIDINDVDAYNNLGHLLKELGRFSEAESCYRTALTITPDSADTYIKLGSLLKSMGMSADSASCYTKALSIDSSREEVHNDLGLALADQGRFPEAVVCYQNALKIVPNYWKAYNNLGLALHSMGRFTEAESAFDKAIALNPTEALLYSNLSLPLVAQGRIKKAENCLKKAIEITPEYVNAYINLGTNYLAQGLAQEAESVFFQALKIEPDSTKAKSNLLFTMNYSDGHNADYRLEQACQYDRIVADKPEKTFTSWQHKLPVKRLRIGLVSGDLRQHPVAYFLENWAQHVDSSRMELIAYLTDNREDAETARLKPHFSGWKSLVGLNDQAAAQLIHSDAVHILLDLSGHTAGNRLPVFAWKPAPVQVSWLGYFATTGMASIDYFIADEVGVPELNKTQFVERIKYLPDTRLCFTAPEVSIKVSPLPALTNGYITFGSFQTMVKAGDDVLALWAELMRALPNAKLRWQCRSFEDSAVADDLRLRLAQFGINSDRLTLLGSVAREVYLAAHAEVDVILDTFPYPGGTTTCEALWMGVPTLTLAGNTLIARQGASLLTAAGLEEWVADSKEDYVSKALLVASDFDKLATLRVGLRDLVLASPLFDAERFAGNMEKALWEMWNESQNTYSPQQFISLEKQMLTDVLVGEDDDASKLLKPSVVIVSATRLSESDFWSKSALGLSLKRHLKQDARLSVKVAFENSRGLPEVFNDCVDQAEDDAILVFVHDDVWLDDADLVNSVIAGLKQFDVIGVVGNKRRVSNQPAWCFLDTKFTWDESANLSGRLARSNNAFGEIEEFGAASTECELLDGVFLACKKTSIKSKNIKFDLQFGFHFYDMDFCRSSRQAGLTLGTWPVALTHQSDGAFGTLNWAHKYQLYINKWEENATQNYALYETMNEVLHMAIEHEKNGKIKLAMLLYQEILEVQPEHAEANHNLGVIEASLKGVMDALPRLEKAVQAKPENEQFWVTYIDALIHSGATDTAVEALELGQKFGLRSEMAQMLATEFIKAFDASVERKQEMQASAIEALNVALKPSEKKLSNQVRLQKDYEPVFYIDAPDYMEFSSGIRALHLLCDSLNRQGFEAYVTAAIVNDDLLTPKLTPEQMAIHKEAGKCQIAVYPEVEMGNPLQVPNVVRYLLHKPNFFVKTSWFGAFHKDEKIIRHGDGISLPWIPSQLLRIQTVDRSIFTPPVISNVTRSGFLVYSHRATPSLDIIPDWCKPFQVISMKNPKTSKQLAELYQRSEGLIVFERTAAAYEAALCGCPVIFSSAYGFEKGSIYYDGYKDFAIAWDFDYDAYCQMKETIHLLPAIYDNNECSDIRQLIAVFNDIVNHFQLNESETVEITPAFALDNAKKDLLQGNVKGAILRLRQSIIDNPSFVGTYFHMGSVLADVGLSKLAFETLAEGDLYLKQLPVHESLNSIRVMFYEKLSELCSLIGNDILEEQYIELTKQYKVAIKQ